MRSGLLVLALTAAFGLAACTGDSPAPGGGDPGSGEVLRLPDSFYGTWELTGTSGGMDGRGYEVPEGIRLVLGRDHAAERRAPGKPVARADLVVSRGKTIFSVEPGWFVAAPGVVEGVVEVSPDGARLTVSDNHPDGFNRHYRRVD